MALIYPKPGKADRASTIVNGIIARSHVMARLKSF
jgi:hypothetical protein